jgi:hypothetical protein
MRAIYSIPLSHETIPLNSMVTSLCFREEPFFRTTITLNDRVGIILQIVQFNDDIFSSSLVQGPKFFWWKNVSHSTLKTSILKINEHSKNGSITIFCHIHFILRLQLHFWNAELKNNSDAVLWNISTGRMLQIYHIKPYCNVFLQVAFLKIAW